MAMLAVPPGDASLSISPYVQEGGNPNRPRPYTGPLTQGGEKDVYGQGPIVGVALLLLDGV